MRIISSKHCSSALQVEFPGESLQDVASYMQMQIVVLKRFPGLNFYLVRSEIILLERNFTAFSGI